MPATSSPHTPQPAGTAPPGEVVLEARDLVKTFTTGRGGLSRTRVSSVDGISLSLRAGESLGIVGESGCGKSTLARMLVGLEVPDSGSISYRGRDVTAARRGDRRLLRRGVQMVFQDPYTSLDPRMTVLEIVGEPLTASRTGTRASRRDRVAELLSLVGLAPGLMERYPHQFSGGQRQRIGIARALALEPEVLVCDEPVSALDVSVQAQVVNVLRDLQRRLGVTLLFIAHDLSVVRHVADRVAVMYLGRIAEIGPTATVYEAPAHPYTQALLSASPVVDRARRGRMAARIVLDGDPPSPTSPPPGCRFHTRCRMARDDCRTDVPSLRRPSEAQERARLAACHHAEDALTRLEDVFGPA
ncbi:ABC transporter ATP-binding protein [Actinoallomurus iriomotensis]|uniref:ABC transporter ATP-binding protein n=1 Tax=Actinoallomurus iriomotensis TaxID=478107 RepID=A0A9W6RS48_9ACTN|nr:oligopeptide/dipeptide ABC transporter ATP-binding protein [Actinoallomurus iriomotensis]GLY80610.1 ABC transporter ATP-binding protein [Actinoallomurus iriomotensis]